MDFGAAATVGDTYVSCNGAYAENICTDCGEEDLLYAAPPVVSES